MATIRRIWLFMRIVWRIDMSDTRMSAKLAWEVSGIIWPKMNGTYEMPSLKRKYKCSKCGYPLGNDDGLCLDCENEAEAHA